MTELIVAPHPDDETIGCGGTIARNSAAGERIVVAFLTSGDAGIPGAPADTAAKLREDEAAAAAEILGVAELRFLRLPDGRLEAHGERAATVLSEILRTERPDTVRLPHPQDGHADHHVSWSIVQQATRAAGIGSPEFLAYEVWTPMAAPDYAEDVTDFVDRKLGAIACYDSQVQQLPYDHAILGLNAYRGAFLAGSRYAEAVSQLWLPD